MSPDARVLKCLCRLQEPGFEPLLEWLQAWHEEARDTMEQSVDERILRVNQGQSQLLRRLRHHITTARDVLTKIETTGR